jgi:hypothetical protein
MESAHLNLTICKQCERLGQEKCVRQLLRGLVWRWHRGKMFVTFISQAQ